MMQSYRNKTGNPAGIIFEHLSEFEGYNFSQSVLNNFFPDKISPITQETMKSFISIMEKLPTLVKQNTFKDNLIIISDALNSGTNISDINSRLNIINSSPMTLKFVE